MDEEAIAQFCAVTDASPDVAKGFLSITNNDPNQAITLFFENPELVSSVQTGAAPAVPANRPSTARSTAGRQDSRGIIHIDSDDDDAMQVDDESEDDRVAIERAANAAQEDEDAAMARKLQEEMYSGQGSAAGGGGGMMGEDGVRAPIGRTTETLVAPDPSWGADDDDGAAQSAILQQLRRRQNPGRPGGGPFSQSVWADGNNPVTGGSEENGSHARRLADLFRPPYDLMERGMAWDDVRATGKDEKKWIMVNLQDMSDFNCQAINRDIWKDEAVKDLVREHFIFLQYDKDYHDSEEFITFYFPGQGHENPDNYPHVSIIDPRTGEQVKVWSGRPFPSAATFHAEIAEFLDRYSLEANKKNPVAKAEPKKPQPVDVDRMTEEEMLEMALKNSMAGGSGGNGGSSSSSTVNLHDPDSLTKADATTEEKGKEPEAAIEQSAWSKISSNEPQEEPENNPATTTRIQFRHPTGRVIRRFNLQDPVRHIYEWLKATPLEGKEGVEFELKKMPQGQDMIESLEATIEETGLKQGTVMIEFVED